MAKPLKNNQNNKSGSGRGGARKGAGRKVGSVGKPRFSDYVTEEDRRTFAEFVMSSYMGDMRLTTWAGDQLFGKAIQAIEMGGPDGDAIPVESKLSPEAEDRLAKKITQAFLEIT